MTWEIKQETKNIPNLDNPVLIEGLPGIGNVGKIAVDFLIEELGAKKLYSFFSHKFPYSVFINEDNLIETPKLELYYKKFRDDRTDLLLLTGDIQPIDEESGYQFCEEILNLVKLNKCSEIITTGGIGLQAVPDEPKVFCTANDKVLLSEYTKKGLGVEKEIFGVVGPIAGVSGILLGLAQRRGVKGVSLLAETFGHPMYLGIKGAKELLKVIEKKFKFNIDIKKMSKEIVEVEKELMKKTKDWANEIASHQAGAKAKSNDASYIG
jgi:uncharacterized protein